MRGDPARPAWGILIAALAGGLFAGGAAADPSLPPVPPEPAASAYRQDDTALGSYLAGRHARARGDYGVAAERLERALERDPDNPSLMGTAVFVLVADGRVEEAAALGRRLVGIAPDAPLARFVVGMQGARDGDVESALGHIGAIPREGVYDILRPLAEGWLHAGAGSWEPAQAALAPLAERDDYRPFFLLHAGLMHDLDGRPAEAEALLHEAVEASAVAFRPAAALGNLFERTGRPDEARELYRAFEARNPDNIWVERALAAMEAGAIAAPLVASASDGLAEALFGTAAAMRRPENGDAGLVYAHLALFLRDDLHVARYLIGGFLEDVGRHEAAVAAYRSIPAGSDFDWVGRLRVAANLAELDRLDEAVALLRVMVDERPERTDAASALGDALRVGKRYGEAAAAYDTAIGRIAPVETHHWRLFYVRGIAFEQTGDWERAEADFMQALELEEHQPLVLNYLGYSWIEQRHNLAKARAMIETAATLQPDNGYIVDSLGWAAYVQGEFDEAVRQLERAAALVAGDPIINDHLGDAYWQVGRLREARFQWERVLTLEPEDALADRVRRKLADGLSAAAEAGRAE